jgi:CMP-N-acetylneuraminic acid synthetase
MEDGADHALIGDLLSKVVHKLETDWAGCSLENMKTITMLQPTTPFRTQDELSELLPSHFQRVIGDNRSLVSLKSVEEVHPSRMYLPSDDGIMRSLGALNAEERLPRQNLTPVYIRDGAYYVMPLHTARLGLSFGSDFIGFIRDGARTINIDSLEHLILSKHYLKTSLVKGDPNDINR